MAKNMAINAATKTFRRLPDVATMFDSGSVDDPGPNDKMEWRNKVNLGERRWKEREKKRKKGIRQIESQKSERGAEHKSDYEKDGNERQDRSTRRLCVIRTRQRTNGKVIGVWAFFTQETKKRRRTKETIHRVSHKVLNIRRLRLHYWKMIITSVDQSMVFATSGSLYWWVWKPLVKASRRHLYILGRALNNCMEKEHGWDEGFLNPLSILCYCRYRRR